MARFRGITHNPEVMGGKATIRGMRVTVAAILRRLAHGDRPEEILAEYPDLTPEDIQEALAYAAWRLEERDYPLAS
jgi:uncharacterized protein (DUF433 family)